MSPLKFELAGIVGSSFVRALLATTRLERRGQEHYLPFRRDRRPVIFVFWHGQLLPLVHYHRNEGAVVLVSEHADGEYIARILQRSGFGTARGSSTRGGTRGLKALIRAARAGRDLALTPDGPRGPARVFKVGALAAAQATGLPVVPVGVGASSAWRFRSWDAFLVPRPFAHVRVEYGAPRPVPRDAGRPELELVAREVGGEIDRLTALAEIGAAG